MAERQVSLGWNDDTVSIHTHACYYYSDEKTLRSSFGFLTAGLDSDDDMLVIFSDESPFGQFREWFEADTGADTAALIASGKLAMIGGAPTMDELVAKIAGRLDQGMSAGYKLIRFLGFIAWGEPGWPDEGDLLEFEARVNAAVRSFPAVIVCTYGVPSLTGRQLIDGGLMTHPVVFLDDRVLTGNPLQRNPAPKPVE